ncbi:MAG: hypothetical protein M0Z52_07030 [Actinomycetota bacterium]|nr:hypothetical protein [Actinomycetota bacterium]
MRESTFAEFIFVTCPVCGSDVDIWAIKEAVCEVCGFKVFKKELTLH